MNYFNFLVKISLVIFLVVLLSCKHRDLASVSDTKNISDSEIFKDEINIPYMIDLNQDYEERKICFQDIADVEYVALETRDDRLIGQDAVYNISNEIIICANYGSGEFLFFNRKGNLMSHFSHQGGSGEEYQRISSYNY